MKNGSREVILEFSLPDFKRKDIDVKVSANSAAVKASKKQENKVQKKNFFHAEKSFRTFNYVTSLPKVTPSKAKISFSKGILKIKVPKA